MIFEDYEKLSSLANRESVSSYNIVQRKAIQAREIIFATGGNSQTLVREVKTF